MPQAENPNNKAEDESPNLRQGERIQGDVEDHYDVAEHLGAGNYADVYKGVCKISGKVVALKRIRLLDQELEEINKEIDVMLTVKHDNCIALLECFENEKEVCLVLEHAAGGELFQNIIQRNKANNKFSEKQAALIFAKIVTAIKYLHSKGIIHRDIKPENILLMGTAAEEGGTNAELDVKLADFNLSKAIGDEIYTNTVTGTMGYCAPEVISRKPYTFTADNWSLGVLLYVTLSGAPPFPLRKGDPMSPIKIKAGKFCFPAERWGHISDEAKDLVRKLLKVNPEERISLDDLEAHPWMSRYAPPPPEEIQEVPPEVENCSRSSSSSVSVHKADLEVITESIGNALLMNGLAARSEVFDGERLEQAPLYHNAPGEA